MRVAMWLFWTQELISDRFEAVVDKNNAELQKELGFFLVLLRATNCACVRMCVYVCAQQFDINAAKVVPCEMSCVCFCIDVESEKK